MLCFWMFYLLLFFFKQKTAYDMRISDWSSDVCSSDLLDRAQFLPQIGGIEAGRGAAPAGDEIDRPLRRRGRWAGGLVAFGRRLLPQRIALRVRGGDVGHGPVDPELHLSRGTRRVAALRGPSGSAPRGARVITTVTI